MRLKRFVTILVASLVTLVFATDPALADTFYLYCGNTQGTAHFCSDQQTFVTGYAPSINVKEQGYAVDCTNNCTVAGAKHYQVWDIIARNSDGKWMAANYHSNDYWSGLAVFQFYGDPNDCRNDTNYIYFYDVNPVTGGTYLSYSAAYPWPQTC